MNNTITTALMCLFIVLLLGSCEAFEPDAPAENELLDGPLEGLTLAETQQFLNGDIAFNDEVFTIASGLGPGFVSTSCGSCHAGDGKGHPFSTLIRFGQAGPGVNTQLNHGGPQLQNRVIPGYQPETLPEGASFSRFMPPANTGLGYLELVSDHDILELADPNDSDGDGISGVPNWISLPSFIDPFDNAISNAEGEYIHRFGKKAVTYNLLHQTVNAYNEDMGITSTFRPIDPLRGIAIDPEVSDQTIHDVVFYLRTLKAPIPRNTEDAVVNSGKEIFDHINCSGCHVTTLYTSNSSISSLSNIEFHPYTDLLLHDMGPGLDDNYTEGNAETYEWRTPPLWGLGLSPNSQGQRYFLMHDGRAESIESAILMHGGEADSSREQYESLSQEEKLALITFLESL